MQMKKKQLDIGGVLLVIKKLPISYLQDEPATLWLIPHVRDSDQLCIYFQKNHKTKNPTGHGGVLLPKLGSNQRPSD